MHWYHQAMIKSYDDARALFKTARKPDEGKPIKSWVRLFRDNGVFELRHGGVVVARITSDNIVTFPMTVYKGRMISNTLSSSLYRVIPFMWMRLGKGRYALEHTKVLDDRADKPYWAGWSHFMREKSPELFSGLQFNLLTGECINPKIKPNSDQVNQDAKTIWLRALRNFKHGIHVRAKLGVVESLCQQVVAERAANKDSWKQPDWTHERWSELLYTSIKQEQFSTELLKGFVMSSNVSYWRHESPTTETTLAAVANVCDDLSVELRRRFGVFDAQ
jgi:hypothetical protein